MATVTNIRELGNQLLVGFDDGSHIIAYPTTGGLWLVTNTPGGGEDTGLSDTLLPGHHITNPGGTVLSGWNWHVANASGRGGDDLNYNFQTFTAPGDGVVDHFDVAGVGMVVRLTLNTPAVRTQPQFTNDAFGPMLSLWFEHCSASVDGPASQGDIIGTSGDGYGAYAPHLHVHGLVDSSNVAGSTNRCCFWNFL